MPWCIRGNKVFSGSIRFKGEVKWSKYGGGGGGGGVAGGGLAGRRFTITANICHQITGHALECSARGSK